MIDIKTELNETPYRVKKNDKHRIITCKIGETVNIREGNISVTDISDGIVTIKLKNKLIDLDK